MLIKFILAIIVNFKQQFRKKMITKQAVLILLVNIQNSGRTINPVKIFLAKSVAQAYKIL